ncbi:hypothetical protein SDC9_189081 [bioreactor metagenome]|uniref:Uncharacterized protein n=1 Tax=bioreactor metagenome TaxID=1076179 RepID=A0A645HTJ8_9ZZZZ
MSKNHSIDKQLHIGNGRINGNITNPFSGNGQRLAVRVDDDRMLENFQDLRHLSLIIDNLAVGFIGNHQNFALVFLLLAGQ